MRAHALRWIAAALAGSMALSACARKRDTQAGVRTLIEKLRVNVYDVAITEKSTREADVTLRVEMTGTTKRIGALAALLPPSAVYRFDLHVVRPWGPDWMVQSAEWQSAEARPS